MPSPLSYRSAAVVALLMSAAAVFAQTPTPAAAPAPAPARAPARPTAALLDRVVAVVNDEVITLRELRIREQQAETQLRRQNIALPAAEVLTKQVLERLILDRAQLQMARETGVRVDDLTVNAAVGRMAEQNAMTLDTLRTRVEADGVSFNRFREDLREEITLARLREREVDNRIQISEGEIDNFIADQNAAPAGGVEFNVAQILLRVPEVASPERVQQVRRRADEIAEQARGGADFAKLAASFSAAPEALQGGELGWRSAERLPTLFVDAVKDLKDGDLSAIIRSPGGFHILKLIGRRDTSKSRLAVGGAVEQIRARHILLRVSDLAPEAEVKRRLAELRDRVVKGGQDFGSLARLYSIDPSSTRGGDLGWLYPGDTVPEFDRAMRALKINEVSEAVQSPFGWHLIQVLERRTEEASAERTRLSARLALRDRKGDEALQDWLRQLRDKTYVEYRLDES